MRQAACAILYVALLLIANPAIAEESPSHPDALSNRIDALLAESWQAAGIEPAPLCDDATFLRRATLDLTGTIPSVYDVRAFLTDPRPDKRERWIDTLLSRPTHATHLAARWRAVLLPAGANVLQLSGAGPFEGWLRQRFAENVPYDAVIRELLTATGPIGQTGPGLYYAALQLKPEELAGSTSRALLGVQMQCAQCHNHPFDHWKQADFWGYAAFFARVQPPPAVRRQPGLPEVRDYPTGEVQLPGTEAAAGMKFLGHAAAVDEPPRTRRQQLAAWMTAAGNPYFARATVNRIWAQMFGRGLVEPVDDLGAHNPPSHPQLLDELAEEFAARGFDLRFLQRTLANTRAYQLASESTEAAETRPELFARMAIKSLSAEQLYDCLAEATRRREGAGGQAGVFVVNGSVYDQRKQIFVDRFDAPTQSATDLQAGIPQALMLMNGQMIAEATDLTRGDLLSAVAAPFFSDEDRVEVMFLSTLSRPPRDDERERFVRYVASGGAAGDPRRALADVLWAVLNSGEFLLNH